MIDLRKLAGCEQITEWVDPWDERLVVATGEIPPNNGATVREPWMLEKGAVGWAEQEVKRLLVARAVGMIGTVETEFDAQRGYVPVERGTVVVRFSEMSDWLQCFPVSEQTEIFKNPEGEQAWAGVALCGKVLGLAVFGQEQELGGVEARVQIVPEDKFRKIVGV